MSKLVRCVLGLRNEFWKAEYSNDDAISGISLLQTALYICFSLAVYEGVKL